MDKLSASNINSSITFKITEDTPCKETVSAMLEAEGIAKDPNFNGYHDVDELFANLDA